MEVAKRRETANLDVNWMSILHSCLQGSPEDAMKLARILAGTELDPRQPSKIDIRQTAELFVNAGRIKECTAFLLSALKDNNPDDAQMQTKVLELNIMQDKETAEAIFQ